MLNCMMKWNYLQANSASEDTSQAATPHKQWIHFYHIIPHKYFIFIVFILTHLMMVERDRNM
jgi:hypothetical protein